MRYQIVFKKSVRKDLRKLPRSICRHILDSIQSLQQDPLPKNATKIQSYEHYYRMRIGEYRVIYHFKKKIEIITIIRVRHRKDAYKNL